MTGQVLISKSATVSIRAAADRARKSNHDEWTHGTGLGPHCTAPCTVRPEPNADSTTGPEGLGRHETTTPGTANFLRPVRALSKGGLSPYGP